MTTDYHTIDAIHQAAHTFAQRIATSVAGKVRKAIKHLDSFDHKAVRETAYRTAYEQAYRAWYTGELIDLMRRKMKLDGERIDQDMAEALADDFSRDKSEARP